MQKIVVGTNLIIGLDEVGRGCLAGPMVAVAAAFHDIPKPTDLAQLTDSKKLSEEVREKLFGILMWHVGDFGVGYVSAEEIDKMGMTAAWNYTCIMALGHLHAKIPTTYKTKLIVDGRDKVPRYNYHQEAIVKADLKVWQVSAASVIAKVLRDRDMKYLSEFYPEYHWEVNKGYGTKDHQEAILKYGPTPLHRRLFLRKLLGREAN